jgi:hypothetical protein
MCLTGISEFLVHAADVEGLCQGIDQELVASKRDCWDFLMFNPLLKSWENGFKFQPHMQGVPKVRTFFSSDI